MITTKRPDRKKGQMKNETYDENEIRYIPIRIFENHHDDKKYIDSNKVNIMGKS